MSRIVKIFEDDKQIYEGNLSVNTVILKGQMYQNPKQIANSTRFTIKISNGKNKSTGDWYKSTFADCSAFGTLGQQILERYSEKDEIWVVGKYYCNTKDGKVYKGFNVRDVINLKAEPSSDPKNENYVGNDDLPF